MGGLLSFYLSIQLMNSLLQPELVIMGELGSVSSELVIMGQ